MFYNKNIYFNRDIKCFIIKVFILIEILIVYNLIEIINVYILNRDNNSL
jgi:hypothetical protein